MAKGWKTYWIVVVSIAACLLTWALLNGRFEIIAPYNDGHGPDPGSREYLAGAAQSRRDAPLYAALATICWLAFSVMMAGVVLVARRAFRLVQA